jgi:hypothetical protein
VRCRVVTVSAHDVEAIATERAAKAQAHAIVACLANIGDRIQPGMVTSNARIR